MSLTPFDFVNAINNKTGNILDAEPENTMYYDPFTINRAFAFFPDTILLANMMNMYPNLGKKPQHDFLYAVVSKGRRYTGKWPKKVEQESVELISDFYNVRLEVAAKYLKMMTDEQAAELLAMLNEGENGTKAVRNKAPKT